MKRESQKVLVTTIRKLLRRDARAQLRRVLDRAHPADLAHAFDFLTAPDQLRALALIGDISHASQVLAELEHGVLRELLPRLEDAHLIELLRVMPTDDTADVLELLEEERRDSILSMMQAEELAETESMMGYDPESAGGIMVREIFAIPQETTAAEALERLQREHDAAETVFYIYVVNDHGHLVGVCSLRDIVRADAQRSISEVMTTEVIRVHEDTDQEEVARLVARYNLIALPVVDANNMLLGIVTVDDIIDVIRSEEGEDMLLMGGAGDEDISRHASALFSFRTRLPWLLPSFASGCAALLLLSAPAFGARLAQAPAVAALLPLIVGMCGYIGTQSSTIVTRGMLLEKVDFLQLSRVLWRELVVGTLTGLCYGLPAAALAATLFAFFGLDPTFDPLLFGARAALALLAVITLAATLGGLMPYGFHRAGIDPAVATGTFVIAAVDLLGVWLYLAVMLA